MIVAVAAGLCLLLLSPWLAEEGRAWRDFHFGGDRDTRHH